MKFILFLEQFMNKITIIGFLVNGSIEKKISKNNKEYIRFKVVTSEILLGVKKKTYHQVYCFGRMASVAKELQEGGLVFVEGQLSYYTFLNELGYKQKVFYINPQYIYQISRKGIYQDYLDNKTSKQEMDNERKYIEEHEKLKKEEINTKLKDSEIFKKIVEHIPKDRKAHKEEQYDIKLQLKSGKNIIKVMKEFDHWKKTGEFPSDYCYGDNKKNAFKNKNEEVNFHIKNLEELEKEYIDNCDIPF